MKKILFGLGVFVFALTFASTAQAAAVSIYSDTSVEIVGVYNKATSTSTYIDLSSSLLNAVRAQEPKPYPTGYVSEGSEVMNSVWDTGVAASYNFQTNAPLADWIWETERAEGPGSYATDDPLYDAAAYTNGRVVVFEKKFNLAGIPQSGTIRITADNAYEVWVNGNYIGRSATAKVAGWELTNLKEPYVGTTGWQTVGNFVIPARALVNGENTLRILAANEYFWSDDGNNPSPALRLSPYYQYNPGALIFKADVNYIPAEPLRVSKTVDESYTKTWIWDIEKTADKTELLLSEGQSHAVNYEVTVDATSANSDYAVSGVITLSNPNGVSVEVTSVVDSLGDVTCPEATPFVIAAGAEVNCSYNGDGLSGEETLNEATVTATNEVFNAVATAEVDWLEAVVTEVDESVDVTDDLQGLLGTVTAANAPLTFKYTRNEEGMCSGEVEEYVQTITNTASFVTSDTQDTDSDSHTLIVTTPCVFGCTLTQGYWKTHSQVGKAPYDDNWAELGELKEATPFSLSQTWYQTFWTPVAGNVYYQLAHQWMAATLNAFQASTPAEVDTALAEAQGIFLNGPAYFQKVKGKTVASPSEIANATYLAGILASYNEGLIGPGHCDEDSSSAN